MAWHMEAQVPDKPGHNGLKLFTQGDRLYDHMIRHIRAARRSVRMECYIFEDDSIGRAFVDAFCERARAGVKVQLHLDALGSLAFSFSNTAGVLEGAGVELKWFNPARFNRLLKLNRRNHRKLMVVDDEHAWLGGFNVHEECSFKYCGEECWRDTQVYIHGPLAATMSEYFDHLWEGRRRWRPPEDPEAETFIISNHNLRQIHSFRRLLKWKMRHAQKSVWLTTPYFMPDGSTQRMMAATAHRGVDVRLIVPFKSDRTITQWAARSAYAQLLRAGIRVFEYQPSLIHAKTAIVDDTWCTVGTANLDYRSFFVNFEMNLVSERPDLIQELRKNFIDCLVYSREISGSEWSRRGLGVRVGELIGWMARKYL